MKTSGHGQSTPITKEIYKRIRSELILDRDKLILDIAYFTGERWGAIIRLRVTDVWDTQGMVRDTITFRASTRKDKKTRQIPVVEELKLRLGCYSPPSSNWLFPSPRPGREGRHITFQAAALALKKAVRRAGLEDLGISTHGTRHNFITALHNAGFSVAYIQSITGHASLSSVSRYIHVDPRGHREAIRSALE